MNLPETLTRRLLPDAERADFVGAIFGLGFPLRVEPRMYGVASRLSPDYDGGFWHFYALANGGFYMAPDMDRTLGVVCANGFDGRLSADAFGITVCLYVYSHLSFGGDALARICADQYHRLRDFALDHAEAGSILAATD